ncbi:MAG: LacI family DNA-binding transcriptional regulator [Bacilli bacterium]|jgi:LacI family transcriptional regulator|nr:LacI family DNA-binding transcriptional regulator [Bacilli bacterium]NLN80369.1 LacI family transcriptional regulator [Erysipelotrichia bacterium]
MNKKIVLEDIAEALNVSKGLVSRALNDKSNVSAKMKKKIFEKAFELNYDFDNLRTQPVETKSLTFVITKRILLKRDHWHRMITSILENFSSYKIDFNHQIYDENDINKKFIKDLSLLETDAYIFIHHNPPHLVKSLVDTKKPIIVVDPKFKDEGNCFIVKYSNYDSIYSATQYLIENGHKSIAFYGSNEYALSNRERHEGFLASIDKHKDKKIKASSILFDAQNSTYEDEELLKKHLKDRSKKITALICVNDTAAINAYKTIKSLGLEIPNDISVIGFDNLQKSLFVDPPLTTFSIPYENIGSSIGHYLSFFEDTNSPIFQQVIVRCKMLVRSSTKPIK